MTSPFRPQRAFLLTFLLFTVTIAGCQTLREIASLRQVDFDIDRVSQANLAGVALDRIQSYSDLRATDLIRITTGIAQKNLPLNFTLHLRAENPATNDVQARLVGMDWTLFIEDRQTVSGVFDRAILLPPGQPTDVPITISLDLYDFFERNAPDLVELALAVTGQGGSPRNIRLDAVPVIDTPLGPIRYPNPITILSRDVGAAPEGR
jgi:hypothetical protein